jgi:tRNA(adenine34) deaminase
MKNIMEFQKFITTALKEAEKAFHKGEVPVGAVLFKENTILSKAHNLVEKRKDASAHAEILCLKKASQKLGDWRLTGTTLITTLEPCIMCAGALILHRVKKIIYLAKDFRHGAHGSQIDVFEKKHPIHHIECEYLLGYPEASQLLKDFFKNRRELNVQQSPVSHKSAAGDGSPAANQASCLCERDQS